MKRYLGIYATGGITEDGHMMSLDIPAVSQEHADMLYRRATEGHTRIALLGIPQETDDAAIERLVTEVHRQYTAEDGGEYPDFTRMTQALRGQHAVAPQT